MRTSNLYIRTVEELEEDLAERMGDVPDQRWTTSQRYRAINAGLMYWGNRVRIPHLYTISGGYTSGTYVYALPDYMDGPLNVQYKAISGFYIGSASQENRHWLPVVAYSIDVSSTGMRELRLEYDIYNTDGRIFWWANNGPVPTRNDVPVTNAALTDSGTSIELTTRPIVGQSGYVKINGEWISYAGIDESTTTVTLENLGRGQFNTTAAAHASGDSVLWGVACPRPDLFEQLMYEACAYLHMLKLNRASQSERGHHQDQMLTYKQMSDEFWKRYAPERTPQFRLNRQAIGPGVGVTDYRVATTGGDS